MSDYYRDVAMRRSPPALGASGSVNASVIFNILYSPYSTVLIYGILPMPAWALGGLWLAYDINGAMVGPSGPLHSPAILVNHLLHGRKSNLKVLPVSHCLRAFVGLGPCATLCILFDVSMWICTAKPLSVMHGDVSVGMRQGRELTPGRASVGYAAHLGGAATGALTYFAYRRGRLRL